MSKKKVISKVPASSSAKGSTRADLLDVELLEKIIKLMTTNDLNTVDVRDGEKRVIFKRGAATITYAHAAPASGVAASAATAPVATPVTAAPTAPAEDTTLVSIKSPMVGTFYAASSPDAKPFVQVGTTVGDDTDVCVIEAMKVFNNIKAETRGTIAKVLVTNGQTVEFGQVLFQVKP